jgi:hypothetical protein
MSGKHSTGLAGEYFVAYKLASMGYHVALTRGNAPNIDVLVSSNDGSKLLAIQVKTMKSAWAPRKKEPSESHWNWPVKHTDGKSKGYLFAFVDLEDQLVFLVPPAEVHLAIKDIKNDRPFFWIYENQKRKYLENWDRVAAVVGPPEP